MGGGPFPIRKISLRFFRKFWGGKNNEFSEKGGGVTPIQMNFVANFWASRKKRNIVFRKYGGGGEGGGSEAVWKFSENSLNLVQIVFPY